MRWIDAAGCAFSCWMVASVWPRRRSSSLAGNVGFIITSVYRSSDSAEFAAERVHAQERTIERRTDAERRAERFRALRDRDRIPCLRAFLQHEHGQSRGAGLGGIVRRETRIRDQREIDHRRVVPLDHDHLQAVR